MWYCMGDFICAPVYTIVLSMMKKQGLCKIVGMTGDPDKIVPCTSGVA